jgi:hypothetical protein
MINTIVGAGAAGAGAAGAGAASRYGSGSGCRTGSALCG